MRKAVSSSILLAISIACTGCSSGGDGGGAGGTGANMALSFDAETALPVSGASTLAISLGADFGLIVSTVLSEAVEARAEGSVGSTRRVSIQVPGLCTGGGDATLDYNSFQPGQDVTLTFIGCVGTVFSGSAVDGTIVLTIEAVSGGFPSEASATADLTAPNTTVTGSFKVKL